MYHYIFDVVMVVIAVGLPVRFFNAMKQDVVAARKETEIVRLQVDYWKKQYLLLQGPDCIRGEGWVIVTGQPIPKSKAGFTIAKLLTFLGF